MVIGRGWTHPRPPRGLGESETRRSFLRDQFQGGAQQRLFQVTVVVAAWATPLIFRPAHVNSFYMSLCVTSMCCLSLMPSKLNGFCSATPVERDGSRGDVSFLSPIGDSKRGDSRMPVQCQIGHPGSSNVLIDAEDHVCCCLGGPLSQQLQRDVDCNAQSKAE